MSQTALADRTQARLRAVLAERTEANGRFFGAETDRLARLCHHMAERFARGGRLVALASTPAARSDARHVAVEFVHPVIVGKRALPAFALTGEASELAAATRILVRPDDIAIAFGAEIADVVNACPSAVRVGKRSSRLPLAFKSRSGSKNIRPRQR